MVSVWGIILILGGAVGGGWAARAFFGDVATGAQLKKLEDDLAAVKRTCESNQSENQVTFAGVQTDIDWLKRELESKKAEPLKPGGRR